MVARINLLDDFAPRAAATVAEDLVGTAGTPEVLAASGNWTATSIFNVTSARRITFRVDYDAAATNGALGIIPFFSAASEQPADVSDASWVVPAVWDARVPTSSISGTFPAGVQATTGNTWSIHNHKKLVIRTPVATAATSEVRSSHKIECEDERFFFALYAEVGVTASPGTVHVTYNLSL